MSSPPSPPEPTAALSPAVQGVLVRAWALTERGQRLDALALLETLLRQIPDSREGLYLRALNLRLAHRITDALHVLDRLQNLHPGFSRQFEERGQCFIELREPQRAIEALTRAVQMNVSLPVSWDLLRQLLQAIGDGPGAATASRHANLLSQLPPEIVRASSLMADGDRLAAEETVRSYLRKDAGNVGAMRLLARLCLESERLEEAVSLLDSVLQLAPDFHAARLDRGLILLRQQRYQQARQEASRLLAHEAGNRESLKLYAAACIGLGDHEPVIDVYDALLRGLPEAGAETSDLRLWRGNALKTTGRHVEAVADYRAALRARPESGVAWFSLANLKTYRFDDADVARMCELESAPATHRLDRCYLSFALGKAFEDRADYARSWRHYESGNGSKRGDCPYDADRVARHAGVIRQLYAAEFFPARAGWGVPDPAPIFVLGLPRSGSTLIEQILASHSQIEGTQELSEIERCASSLRNGPGDVTAEAARHFGQRYLDETRVYRTLGRPHFIDKMPDNFWHIGLISLLLPRATIIDVRREPMACCVGNFKQLFGGCTQAFSYGLEDMARHYRTYLALMGHWHSVLPGRVLTVHHEDIVNDLEGSVRRVLAHCGLSFEPACLEFHKTRRSVRSPSSEQVRVPVTRESIDQWRHYEAWLDPLRLALGDALSSYRT